ncbi:Protein of unknown function [Pyronema omphalodes CBS 100304]|uniref:Uncharacterized protein n=1 Tax=Pyronema omphalodes (strain CBS 100304) TaxID=1076935 RepID=U4LGL3_PYROM|nr:Protein of unknown function [Pyronema omphalodes CBS 100304]
MWFTTNRQQNALGVPCSTRWRYPDVCVQIRQWSFDHYSPLKPSRRGCSPGSPD